MLLGIFKLTDGPIYMDVYDNERVPPKGKSNHYITPNRIIKAKTWYLENKCSDKMGTDEASQLIAAGIIGTYHK